MDFCDLSVCFLSWRLQVQANPKRHWVLHSYTHHLGVALLHLVSWWGSRQTSINKLAYLLALAWWHASQPLQESGGVGGRHCRVRPAHPQNSSEPTSRENLCGNFLRIIGRTSLKSFVLQGLGRFSRKIRQRFQVKSMENPPKNPPREPLQNPPEIRRKICRKIRQKIRCKIRHKICHGNTHLQAAVIAQALQPVCATSPGLFWMFNRNKTSTFRCKIHSKLRQKNSPWTFAKRERAENSKTCLDI